MIGTFQCDELLIRARGFRSMINKLIVVFREHTSVLALEHAVIFGSNAGLVTNTKLRVHLRERKHTFVTCSCSFAGGSSSCEVSVSSISPSRLSLSSTLSALSLSCKLPSSSGCGAERVRGAFLRSFAWARPKNLILGAPASPNEAANASTGNPSTLKIDLS